MAIDTGTRPLWRRSCKAIACGLAMIAVAGVVRTDQLAADSDGDGAPDCRERSGLHVAGAPNALKTNPDDADTDGDRVVDGREIHLHTPADFKALRVWSCPAVKYVAWSDPTLADTDDDGLDDAVELSEGSDPRAADNDNDGLSDVDEREWGSDPDVADTDGDGFPDGKDLDDGFSPVAVDDQIDDDEWHTEYAKGVGLGEFDDINSVPQLLGALSGGAIGSIPVVGWVVSALGDIRDAIAGIVNEDWTAVLTSAAAVLPYAGDSAKAVKQVTRFAEKHPEQLRRLVDGILALEKVPESVRASLLRAADGIGVDGLRDLEVSDEVIIKLARRGTNLAALVKALATTSALIQRIPSAHADDDGFVSTLADAQAALREYATEHHDPDDVADSPFYLDDFPASTYVGGRQVDACTRCSADPGPGTSTLRVAKLGSLHHSGAVRSQIDKDAYLIDQGFRLEWHFFAGPTGWTVDPAVLESLNESGIPFFIHVPD